MRALLILWLLTAVVARAEEPIDNGLLSPSPNYVHPRFFDYTAKPYIGKDFDASKSSPTKGSSTQPFRFVQKLFGKAFATRDFSSNQYHTGDFKVAPANVPKESRYAKKSAKVRQIETQQAHEEDKSAVTGGHAIERGKNQDLYDNGPGGIGRSQYSFDKEGPAATAKGVGWKGKLEPLSIGEIRELLNKNK